MNTLKNILESEQIYIPWLIDLSYLNENVVERKSRKMGFELSLPNTSIHDSVPYPQLVTNLVITISYLEKGLKYLLLAQSEEETYHSISKNRRFQHNLKNIYDQLILIMPTFISNFKPKSKKLFYDLLKTNYTNLRYLHIKESITINEKTLIDVIISFKNTVLNFREKNIYSNENFFSAIKENKHNQILINYPIIKFPPKSISIHRFNNIISGKNNHQVIPSQDGTIRFANDIRLSVDERDFINSCYKQESDTYQLHTGLSIRSLIRLFKLFQKIRYSFANWDYPTLHINK